jgi:hypothetical protein
MRYRALLFFSVLAFGLILLGSNINRTVAAKNWGFANDDLAGWYTIQLTGNYVFPKENPLSALNGPFVVTGRIWSDGKGHLVKRLVSNYNGQVYHLDNLPSTYSISSEGMYTETFPVQLGPTLSATITFEGVIMDDGNQVRLMVSGFSAPLLPMPAGYAGMVISGSMIKQ